MMVRMHVAWARAEAGTSSCDGFLESTPPISTFQAPPCVGSPLQTRYTQFTHPIHTSLYLKDLLHLITMAGRRFGTLAAVAGLGGGAYYMYSAGGDPKLAEKKFERKYHSGMEVLL